MEAFVSKTRLTQLMYELTGTAILTIAFNMQQGGIWVFAVFLVSIWAWEYCGAAFNMAVSLGTLISES